MATPWSRLCRPTRRRGLAARYRRLPRRHGHLLARDTGVSPRDTGVVPPMPPPRMASTSRHRRVTARVGREVLTEAPERWLADLPLEGALLDEVERQLSGWACGRRGASDRRAVLTDSGGVSLAQIAQRPAAAAGSTSKSPRTAALYPGTPPRRSALQHGYAIISPSSSRGLRSIPPS